MTTRAYLKRAVSAFLAFAIILGCVPAFQISLPSFAASGNTADNRVTDPSTLDRWMQYFGPDVMHTQNAGGVWLDKSVLTDTSAFPNTVKMTDANKNFLVALSAIAANKEIVGFSSIPTDTMLVLDMSSSMNTAGAIDDLAVAANNAIKALYAENKNNRVGVVCYSGNDDTFVLMPLDRYSSSTGNYLEHYTSGGRSGIRICRNVVKNSAGTTVNSGDTYHTGTFTQDGIYVAMKQLLAADKTVDGGIQAGRERMPIMVLMSDGEPTHTTNSFDGSGAVWDTLNNAAWVSGIKEGSGQDFLTQLTAAYSKYMLENSANGYKQYDLLFYTLGFDMQGNPPVLRPELVTSTDSYWNRFLAGGNVTVTDNKTVAAGSATYKDFIAKLNSTEEDNLRSDGKNKYRYYVDAGFSASTANGLNAAFQSIVQEIILQSRYYATHLEGGTPDLSGYITFEDQIGAFMEVKDIKGILLGDTLFTGAALTSMLNSNQSGGLGSVENPSALGLEFIGSVKERLGITDTMAAIALIDNAYKAGQLSYTSDTQFNNYIGWYAAADGSYVGFWNEGVTVDPAEAVYKIKSYGFLGQAQGNIKDSDMMYMTVQVRTHIASGNQTVIWKIPAALIPMVTYKIQLDGDSEATATNVQLSREGAEPIRLLFETGLRSNINALNVGLISDPKHVGADGSRLFWTNHWDISATEHEDHVTTFGSFTPSTQNERFYYTSDAIVYKLENGNYVEVSSDEALDPNGVYYHARYIFRAGISTAEEYFEQISAESLALAQKNTEDGNWYIPLGTVYRYLANDQYLKIENKTESAKYSAYSHIEYGNSTYEMRLNLGNNGLLKLVPATGIKLSKTLSQEEPGTSTTFRFKLVLKDALGNPISGSFDTLLADLDQFSGISGTMQVVNGEATVVLNAGKTLYITGLPAGASYTVEEVNDNPNYKVQSVYVNGIHKVSGIASGTLTDKALDDVDFVNRPLSEGDLIIRKSVIHPFGAAYVIPADKKFQINVEVTNTPDGVYQALSTDNNITSVTVVSGKFSVMLGHGQEVAIQGLPEDAQYTITEVDLTADGFTLDETASSNLQGSIPDDSNVQAMLVNKYEPVDVDLNATIKITKELTGRDWVAGDAFVFAVEQVAENGSVVKALGNVTIDNTGVHTASFNLNEIYTEVGTYYYRIREIAGAADKGITYDSGNRYFSVTVSDVDMDGKLEIASVVNILNTEVNGNTVSAIFSNSYAAYGETTASIQVQKKMEGNNFALNGFRFGLYSDEACTQLVQEVLSDVNGKAIFELTYTAKSIGLHTYYIKEIDTGINGMTYSQLVYKVDVTVVDNLDGTIGADVVLYGIPTGETMPVFTNTYIPEKAILVISGSKELIGRELYDGEFSFNLYETDSDYSISGLSPIQTVVNTANGDFMFKSLTYTAPGTHYYVVNEVQGSLGGVSYDGKVYQIKVIVTDENGVLKATVSGVESGIRFINNYDPADVDVILSGNKVLTGRELNDGEFSFVLKDAQGNPLQTVQNVGGSFTFDKLDYDQIGVYTYTVHEVQESLGGVTYDQAIYTVVVTITDDGAGKLHAQVRYQRDGAAATGMVFRNAYAIDTPFEIKIDGDKVLTGRDLTAGEFEFVLLNALTGQEIGRAKNDASGKFAFAPYSVRAAGVYYFAVVEVNDSQPGMDYDASVIEIVVTLADNGDGTLRETGRTITGGKHNNATVSFTNTYYYGTLAVEKEVAHTLGADQQMTNRKFDIQVDLGVALAGKTYVAAGAGYTSITLDSHGRVVLQLSHGETVDIYGLPEDTVATITELNTPDSYVQSFRESPASGAADGVVTIVRNATVAVDVVNLYAPQYLELPATVIVSGDKIFTGRTNDEWLSTDIFTVKLQQWNGSAWVDIPGAEQVLNDGKKTYSFELHTLGIQYTTPGTYSYQVVEVIPEAANRIPGVTYDRTLHTFTVTVTDPDMIGLVIESVIADETNELFQKNGNVWSNSNFDFHNAYSVTGTVPVDINIQKGAINFGGNPVNLGQFQFKLSPVNGTPGEPMYVYVDSVGEARFFLTFTVEGTYEYILEEVIPAAAVNNKLNGMTYDSTEYTVTIVVSDDHHGGLKADVTIVDELGNPYSADQELVFQNAYDPEDVTLNFDVSKKLIGRELEAGEFKFILKQWLNGGWTKIATGTNAADGTVSFVADNAYSLDLTKVGIYFYQISEDTSVMLPGVTNDTALFEAVVTVTDNNGKLEAAYRVESLADTKMVFTNVYDAKDATYIPDVKKEWTSVNGSKTALVGGEFRFELKRDGVLIGNGTNDANGKVIFTEVYTGAFLIGEAGEYTYTIAEVAGGNSGITYDDTVYSVVVAVQDNTETGELEVVETTATNATYIFRNSYQAKPADLVLEGTKNYNIPLQGGEFEFLLTPDSGNPAGCSLVNAVSVRNGAHGKFVFEKINFTQPGEYKFTVKELKPANALASITYDETVHNVIVKVADNGQGQLYVASINEDVIAALNLVFTNIYDAKDTSFVPTVNKLWEQGNGEKAVLVGGEFRFELKRDGVQIGIGTNDANGKVIFTELYANAFVIGAAGDYIYTITEVNGGQVLNGVTYDNAVHTVKITVVDNTQIGELQIVNVQGNDVSFTNSYKAEDAELTLEGLKNYNLPLQGGEFTFELYDAQGNLVDRVQNDGNKKFAFKKLLFNAPGEYKYTVKEYKPDDASPSITYDEKVHEVTIKVVDNKFGQLVVNQVNGKAAEELNLSFTNIYKAQPTQFVPNVSKLWEQGNGKKAVLVGGEFRFELKRDGVLIGYGINDANGKVTFTEVYANAFVVNEAGTYVYTIAEVNGGQTINGVTYDDTLHAIKVTIVDNTVTGKLEISNVQGDNVSFTNSYKAEEAELILDGKKHYNLPLQGGEFTFELYDAQGRWMQSVKNDGNSKFAFEKLNFNAPGEYKFTVKEHKPADALESITYDETVHNVIVNVADDGQGKLYVESINGDQTLALDLSFTNVYNAKDVSFVPNVNKLWEQGNGKKAVLVGGEFHFELKRDGVQIGIGTNDANGKVIFTELYANAFVISAAGDYTYTITEVNGGQVLNGVTYDNAVHTVKITVVDNTQIGELQIVNVQGNDVSFTNSYKAGDAELILEGLKNYNLPLQGGEFTFELYDAQRQLLQSVKNGSDSKFVFEKLVFSTPGEYKYTVKEYKPDDASPSITYDEKINEIIVNVADDQLGQLYVNSINGKAVEELNLTFVNVYTKPADVVVELNVNKVVENKGTAVKGPDGFVFILKNEVGEEIGRIVSDAEGKASFESILYTEGDIGKTFVYTISEEQGDLTDMEYDATVHTVTVEVVLNQENVLVAMVNGEAASSVDVAFVNVYTANIPYTGDRNDPMLWVAVLFVTGGALGVLSLHTKRKNKAQ